MQNLKVESLYKVVLNKKICYNHFIKVHLYAKFESTGENMEIKRDLYIEQLVARKHNNMIKVITGIRRCGKSYLLFNLFKEHLLSEGVKIDHIIELSLDNIENKKYRDPNQLYNYVKHLIVDKDMYYVFLDEVQMVNEFEDALNGFLHIKNVDVYITGSNAKFLSKDIVTEFRGRGDQVHIYPLSFKEYYSCSDKSETEALKDYMYYGGLPQIVQMINHLQKQSYLNNLLLETYISDIINRNNLKNDVELSELLDILASYIGSLTSSKKLVDSFKSIKNSSISIPTINNYLNYFMDSFLIDKAIRYDIKGKKYIDTPSKYYFVDLGLRNARLSFRQIEENHLLENLIYNELKIRGFSVDVGEVIINTKDSNNKQIRKRLEVDFVCNKADERYYIQFALTLPDKEKMEQEQRSLINIKDSFQKIIISKDDVITHYNEDGILILNIFDFLLGKSILK